MRCSVGIACLLALAGEARAFNEASQFFAPAGVPHAATLGASAEGVYFTGAPRYSGLDCATCHTDGPQQLTIELGADVTELFTTGYEPGRTYELEVALGNEREGLQYGSPACTDPPSMGDTYAYQQCNNNNFALEIDTAFGVIVGPSVFCAAPPSEGKCPAPNAAADEVVIAPDGDAVFANHIHSMSMPYQQPHNDMTSWHLWWIAPPAGSGPLAIYVAAVDGNGGSGSAVSDQDPYGDDTVRAIISVEEQGAPGAFNAMAGCAYAGTPSSGTPCCALLLALCWRARRRRTAEGR